jgi:hypothetical protein
MQTDMSKRQEQDMAWDEAVLDYARDCGLPMTAGNVLRAERALIDSLHTQARPQAVVAPQLHEGSRPWTPETRYQTGAVDALRRVRDALGDRNCAHDITVRNVARDLGVEL